MAIERLGDRLLGLQFCDSISGDLTHYPVGSGKVDLQAVLKAMKKIKFHGYLMLEIYHGGKDAKELVDAQYASAMEMIEKVL
jgi:sugar phosphate isomerase/epimerase